MRHTLVIQCSWKFKKSRNCPFHLTTPPFAPPQPVAAAAEVLRHGGDEAHLPREPRHPGWQFNGFFGPKSTPKCGPKIGPRCLLKKITFKIDKTSGIVLNRPNVVEVACLRRPASPTGSLTMFQMLLVKRSHHQWLQPRPQL